ncbi:MAG: hypothetical protein O7I42_17565 [Alphaproteobacteria bacterium]|nr:hypothetical protein [Alphaproteobacteria bacterium]
MNILHPELLSAAEARRPVDIRVWRHGVVSVPLLNGEYCRYLISKAERMNVWDAVHDEWERQTAGQKGKEVGIGTLDEAERFVEPFEQHLMPAVKAYYKLEVTKILEPFIIRYTIGGITAMKRHKDRRGLVSGAIRLNDEFEGCRFRFPDLDFDAGVVPVGHILMFPKYYDHEVTELTAGKRYSLAIWINGEPLPQTSTAGATGATLVDRGTPFG